MTGNADLGPSTIPSVDWAQAATHPGTAVCGLCAALVPWANCDRHAAWHAEQPQHLPLNMNPGDVILISVPEGKWTPDQATRVRDMWRNIFPDNEVIVTVGVNIKVTSP